MVFACLVRTAFVLSLILPPGRPEYLFALVVGEGRGGRGEAMIGGWGSSRKTEEPKCGQVLSLREECKVSPRCRGKGAGDMTTL